MIEDSINGNFKENKYDESKLSKIESKWMRYLTASKMSSLKVLEERNDIQEMVSDISHQTKTPLSNILLYTELLKEKVDTDEEKFIVEQILSQSEKLEFLIQSLVKMSRLESNVISLAPIKQPIHLLIEQAVHEITSKADAKNIIISMEDTKEEAVYDLKWSAEALFNILDNAVKYSEENTKITITVKSYEFYIDICVADQGIGITDEEKIEIFKRFYRGNRVLKKEGVGIGLYLTKEIIRRQGGYIKAGQGKEIGSVFEVYLPINVS